MSVESVELLRRENTMKIIQSVKKLLCENSISDISLGIIARKAGVAVKTINNIFGTKNSLLILTAISAYKDEYIMLDKLISSKEFSEKSGLDQIMNLHYERAKFQKECPYMVSLISEIERLKITNEKEIEQCNQYLIFANNISSYYEASIKKGHLDGSIKKNINTDDILPMLFFSFGAVTQKLQTISFNELMNKKVDSYNILRTVLKITKDYLGT